MSLSKKAESFQDSKGKFHDSQEKADHASAQYILDAANPNGSLSIQALITLLATNPDFRKLVDDEVTTKMKTLRQVDNSVSESGSQGGTAATRGENPEPHPGKKHSHG